MALNLHVEQLTLANLELSPGQRSRFQSALQHELARLLSEQGIPPSLQQDRYLPTVSLDASQVRMKDAVQLGQHLARSLYRDLCHGTTVEPTQQRIASTALPKHSASPAQPPPLADGNHHAPVMPLHTAQDMSM